MTPVTPNQHAVQIPQPHNVLCFTQLLYQKHPHTVRLTTEHRSRVLADGGSNGIPLLLSLLLDENRKPVLLSCRRLEDQVPDHPDETPAPCLFRTRSVLGNIYAARVERVLPGKGVFLQLETGRKGYLPKAAGKLVQGSLCLVQVQKDAAKTKDCQCSQDLSFKGTGCILTFSPVSPVNKPAVQESLSLSKKISKELRASLKSFLLEQIEHQFLMEVPAGYSPCPQILIRTAAADMDRQVLLSEILETWRAALSLIQKGSSRQLPGLLKQDESFFAEQVQTAAAFSEKTSGTLKVVTDLPGLHAMLSEQMPPGLHAMLSEQMLAGQAAGVYLAPLYQDDYPLCKLYSIETKLRDALSKTVYMKSGGNLIIEHTEALTVIDVNTAKGTEKIGRKIIRKIKGSSDPQEADDPFLAPNLEAAKEIARQIMIRNLSGIILVDFINMKSKDSEGILLSAFQSFLRNDPRKVEVFGMTKLGLCEIARERRGAPLYEVVV